MKMIYKCLKYGFQYSLPTHLSAYLFLGFIALLKKICSSRSVILALIVGGSIHMVKNLAGINAIV